MNLREQYIDMRTLKVSHRSARAVVIAVEPYARGLVKLRSSI